MTKSTVNKLENGGFDVEFEGGGRVILNEGEASSVAEAKKLASDRLQGKDRVGDDDSTESTADTARASAAPTRTSDTQDTEVAQTSSDDASENDR